MVYAQKGERRELETAILVLAAAAPAGRIRSDVPFSPDLSRFVLYAKANLFAGDGPGPDHALRNDADHDLSRRTRRDDGEVRGRAKENFKRAVRDSLIAVRRENQNGRPIWSASRDVKKPFYFIAMTRAFRRDL